MSPLARLRRWTVWPMLWKEFVQVRRDRFTMAMMVGIPAIQLVLFGYAIQTEVRHQPLLVVDQSRTVESRALVAAMINTSNFDLAGEVGDARALERAIAAGRARAGLVIPADYARNAARGQPARAQLLVDAADPIAANGAMAAAQQAGLVRSRELAAAGRPGLAPMVEVRVRPLYNPAVRSAVFIVPGIIGVLLSITMVLIASMAVVRERERGTLEQLVVTPIGKTSLMLGKMAPFLIIGYVQVGVILLLGRLLFRVPFQGSVPLLLAFTLPFILASLGLGLLFSTLVRTQAQAMQLGFFYLMPNILLSGFMFPREAMPPAAQWIAATLPLTYFLEVLRGILLKGVGFEALWREGLILAGFAVGLTGLAVVRFRKGLE
ncbi:MAG TPA: ABC transporter permease [Gemmatimonadales bacterium]|nr:ABC transporter permease [Gemmatimonadales bacterium]